jgi:Amt family ammonium transporter
LGRRAVLWRTDKLFLKGIAPDTLSGLLPTIPEYVFVAFQSTFAAITVALIVGSFAERIKFAAVLIFAVLWFTFSYIPMAHMVWGGGLLGKDGALDFAGGTVVHINAGIAGLVGAYMVGKRIGFGKEALTPHSLTLTMVGASLLWVGWFGFNAGSAGAANGSAGLAFINTTLATARPRCPGWPVRRCTRARPPCWAPPRALWQAWWPSPRPQASSAPWAPSCWVCWLAWSACGAWAGLKKMLGADDAFDVFGVHGVGGIVGAILTGVFASQSLGGTGGLTPDTYAMGARCGSSARAC